MSREPDLGARRERRILNVLGRTATTLLALAALFWVISVFPNTSSPALSRVASRIARGENYEPDALRQMVMADLRPAQRVCDTSALRNLLILQIDITNDTVRSTDLKQADIDIAQVEQLSKVLLSCAPSEALGWFGSFWSQIRQGGLNNRAIALLGESYHFAPHEAWIQLVRAPLALRSFDELPAPLQDAAIQDFMDIYKDSLFQNAALLFKETPPPDRAKLLDRTCDSIEHQRLVFLHFVNELGLKVRHDCYPADDRPAYMRD
jgi:hypothetical protein